MAMRTERQIPCDALVLKRQNIEAQYNHVISTLPQHGKGVATERDHDDERKVRSQIKSSDASIESYHNKGSKADSKTNDVALPQTRPVALSSSKAYTPIKEYKAQGHEPYINPFTGQWVVPDYLNNLGPSGTARDKTSGLASGSRVAVEAVDSALDGIALYGRRGGGRDDLPPLSDALSAELDVSTQAIFVSPVGHDHHFEHDRRKAMELAGDVPPDHARFRQAQQARWHADRQRLQAMQDMGATLAQVRSLHDALSRADQLLRREQEMAQPSAEQEVVNDSAVVLKEMRQMQEQMQAEDNRRFEEDRNLARRLAERDDRRGTGQSWQRYQPPYRETQFPGVSPDDVAANSSSQQQQHSASQRQRPDLFRQPKKSPPPPPARSPLFSAPSGAASNSTALGPGSPSHGWPPPRRPTLSMNTTSSSNTPRNIFPLHVQQPTPPHPFLYPANRDGTSASLNATINLQQTWGTELRPNDAAARAAQEEVRRPEKQARREFDRLHHREAHRRQAELQRHESERLARLAMEAECSVCGESLPKDQLCRLSSCPHRYCRDCMLRAIQTAVADKKVFQCCKMQVDARAIAPWLPGHVAARYASIVEELATPNPTYCSARACAAFIPPRQYQGDIAVCERCAGVTCRLCKAGVHPGVVCEQDAAGLALLRLAGRKKWTQCPRCRNLVERESGCLHMACRCGMQFCYNCGRPSSQCGGESCKRR